MGQSPAIALAGFAMLWLGGCGGGSTQKPPPANNYDFRAGMAALALAGESSNIQLSGTLANGGTSTTFSGSGTLTLSPASNATFSGMAAWAQRRQVNATVVANGQALAYATDAVDYYSPGGTTFLGTASSGEFDIAPTPIVFPSMVFGSGQLGSLNRYADSTMGISLGTVQLSYTTLSPVDPRSPAAVLVGRKVLDLQGNTIETDVTEYYLDASSAVSLVSSTLTSAAGTIDILTH